jgi:predicted secreted protein
LEAPASITVHVGEEQRVHLPGAGSSGYTWVYHVDGPQGAISLRFEPAAGPPAPSAETPQQTGSVEQLLIVRGVHPGKVGVRLELRRPWEKNKPPRLEHTLGVTVK